MHVSRLRLSATLLVLATLLEASPMFGSSSTRGVAGVRPQFGLGGLAASKLMQEFHLPSSPTDLFEFVMEYELKQKIATTLPLNLDAKSAFPVVENAQLPGGPFAGKPLSISTANARTVLAPGDYVLPVMAYCTQYSVHRPGQGTAYKLAPVEGTQAEAIATLLWRGTLAGKRPQELQATNWAIQSGMTYSSMPKPYQALIDQLIPDYKEKLRGNALDVVQTTYKDVSADPRKFLQAYIKEKYNKTVPLMILPKIAVPAPPLEAVLVKIGPAGHMVLDAKKQSDIMLTAYTTKERGEQTLFEGQGEQLPPEPAAEGPWTERVPGRAYMRFIVKSGNMHGDNLMQIRILPHPSSVAASGAPRLVEASFAATAATSTPSVPATSVYGLLGVKSMGESTKGPDLQALISSGVIGYSVGGGGAQALVPVVAAGEGTPSSNSCLKKLIYEPYYYNGVAGLCVYVGANSAQCSSSGADFNWVQAYETNYEKKRPACKEGIAHPDPCPYEAKESPASELYRPYGEIDEFRSPSIAAWSRFDVDYIFRDSPNRSLEDLARRAGSIAKHRGSSNPVFEWHTAAYDPTKDHEAQPGAQPMQNAGFVSLPKAGAQQPFTEVASFSYGFEISADQQTLSVDALKIDGKIIQGPQSYSIQNLKEREVPDACKPEHPEVLAPPPASLQP